MNLDSIDSPTEKLRGIMKAPSYFLGFDPGGADVFGWAVGLAQASEPPEIIGCGSAPNAQMAVQAAQRLVPSGVMPSAAGIDAPLFWTPTGVRKADGEVRGVLRRMGASSPGGTVQQLNSLRGACLVQGILAGILLRKSWPEIGLTETHPKALLWHLGLATSEVPAARVQITQLIPWVRVDRNEHTEHERDAIISVAAAAAWGRRSAGWRDLVGVDPDALFLVPGTVAYWMPQASLTRAASLNST